MKNYLKNIFKNFPLHTSKNLDFESFFEAYLIRKKGKLSESDINKILFLIIIPLINF